MLSGCLVCQERVSHGAGDKITSKDMQRVTRAMLPPTSGHLAFPPSPAGNSAAEVSFEEPVGADLQIHDHPGTEVGGGCLETEHRQSRKESSLPTAHGHVPQGTQWG